MSQRDAYTYLPIPMADPAVYPSTYPKVLPMSKPGKICVCLPDYKLLIDTQDRTVQLEDYGE